MPENDRFATYTEYSVERGTIEDPGIHLMPVAGPAPQEAQIVVLHAPIEYTWVAGVGRRRGAPCVMPDPYALETQDGNLRYLGGQVSAIVPHPTGEGTHEFLQAGMYWYGKLFATGLTNTINLGRMPWEFDQYGDPQPCVNNLPANLFRDDILCGDPVVQPGSPGADPLPPVLQNPLQNVPQNIIQG